MKKIVKLCGIFLAVGSVSVSFWELSNNHLITNVKQKATKDQENLKKDHNFLVSEKSNDDYQVSQQGRSSDRTASPRTQPRPQPQPQPRPDDDLDFPVLPNKPKIGFIIPPQNLNEFLLAIKACGPIGPSVAESMHSYWTLVDAIDKTIKDNSPVGYSILFLKTAIKYKYPQYQSCITPDARELRSFAQYNKLQQMLIEYVGKIPPIDVGNIFNSEEFALNLWILKNVNLKRGVSHADIFRKLKEIFIETRAKDPSVNDDTIEALWKEAYVKWEEQGLFLLTR